MVPEATLRETSEGLVPAGEGWYVLEARRARWVETPGLGRRCDLEGEADFPQLGFRLVVLEPGQPNCMYHGESDQEDFLVVAGECILVVEGQERRLRRWDFVHCPAGTRHVFVGAGKEPCVIVMVGARTSEGSVLYPVEEAAARHGASVERETTRPEEAYARFPRRRFLPYRHGDLPG